MKLNDGQKVAIQAIKNWAEGKGNKMLSLTGYAGTGKTSIIVEAKKHIPDAIYCALTGKASLRLSELASVSAGTLHSVLYTRPEMLKNGELEFNRLNDPPAKHIVIDESSMITPKLYNDLQTWTKLYGTRILFVGDSFQLPPVLTETERKKHGDFTIFNHIKGAELTEIMRSNDGIVEIASIVREEKRIPIHSNNSYSFTKTTDPIEYAINQYLDDPNDHMLITWRNQMRMEANHRIRKKLGHTHHLPDKGEPIIFCRNGQGVLNGQIGIVKNIVPGPTLEGLITYRILLEDKRYVLCSITGKDELMDGGTPTIKNWKKYVAAIRSNNISEVIPITYGYVGTAHKCQGNEWRRISIMLQGYDINNTNFRAETTLPNGKKAPFGVRFLYTSLTRAKNNAILIIGT